MCLPEGKYICSWTFHPLPISIVPASHHRRATVDLHQRRVRRLAPGDDATHLVAVQVDLGRGRWGGNDETTGIDIPSGYVKIAIENDHL